MFQFFPSTIKLVLKSLAVSLLFFGVANFALAADVAVSPSTGSYSAGQTFTVTVRALPNGDNINAVESVLNFDPALLSVVSVSKDGSVFSLWTTEPAFNNANGTVSFGGGSPTPFTSTSNILSVTFRAVANGTATVESTTGTVTYLPAPGFVGIDTFEYQVCDDAGSCATATVTVEVGDPPPLGAPDFAVTDEDTPVTIGVLGNDADPTGQQLFIGGVTQPANGTVIVNPDGTVTYTPDADFKAAFFPAPYFADADFNGEDTFTYLVCDFQPPAGLDLNAPLAEGTSCEEVDVTVTVTAINDAPIFTVASVITIGAGETMPTLTGSDVDGSTFVFSIVGGALPPGVTLNPDGSFTGTTTVLGTYVFTVQVCDGESPPACSVVTFSLVVQALPTTGSSPAAWAILALLLLLAGFGVVRLTDQSVPPLD